MKLQQLEYVIAIAQEGSITAAAKKLYQAQPNISIALKELESEIGTQIFWRTPNGMVLTPEGEDFLVRAKEIVESMHSLESDYSHRADDTISLRIEANISTYMAAALGVWVNSLDPSDKLNIHLIEIPSNKVIDDVSSGRADIGIIRIPSSQLGVYAEQLKSRKLSCRTVTEFTMKLLMRKDHPLAKYDDVPIEELKKYIQILHGDDEMNLFGKNSVNPEFDEDAPQRTLHVYDRGSKMALMDILKDAYMWVSPMPNTAFAPESAVVVKNCSYANIKMRDLVICKKANETNRLIKEFLEFLNVFIDRAFEQHMYDKRPE
jgi:DNA-binding transcriptional LysR family regulator